MIPILAGATDTSVDVQVVDDTGLPVTGLDNTSFPTVKYSKGTGADATISLSALSAVTDAHSDGGVIERGEGVYRLDLPDAVTSTVAPKVTIRGEATDKRLICPALTITSATRGLAGTALPAAAADAAGGLPISDAGGLDLDTQLAATNEITAARMGALTDWIDGGRLDLLIDAILTDTDTTIPGLISGLNDPTAVEIRTEIDDNSSRLATIAGDILTMTLRLTAARAGYLDNLNVGGDVASASDIGALNDLDSTAVQAAAAAALVAIHLDHLFAAEYDPASKPGSATALLNEIFESDSGVSRFTANALEQGPTDGSGTTPAAVWAYAARTLTSNQAVIINPVAEDSQLTLHRLTDYNSTLNNAPQWTSDSTWTEATWASSTGVFRYQQKNGDVTAAGTVAISQSGDVLTATLTLTDTETGALVANSHGRYEVEITTTGGLKRMLASGELKVLDRVGNS